MQDFVIDLSTGEQKYVEVTPTEESKRELERQSRLALTATLDLDGSQSRQRTDVFLNRVKSSKAGKLSDLEDRVVQLEGIIETLVKKIGL